jgi:hypothetical protein
MKFKMCGSCGVRINIPQGKKISAFSKKPSPASTPTQLSDLWVSSSFPEVKSGTDYTLPNSTESWSFISTRHVISCHDAKLSIEKTPPLHLYCYVLPKTPSI